MREIAADKAREKSLGLTFGSPQRLLMPAVRTIRPRRPDAEVSPSHQISPNR